MPLQLTTVTVAQGQEGLTFKPVQLATVADLQQATQPAPPHEDTPDDQTVVQQYAESKSTTRPLHAGPLSRSL